MPRDLVRLSKFLSLVLRHRPERIGLTLDAGGWANVDELLRRARASDEPMTRARLERVVRENDKQRFAFSADGTRIRARQGHSIDVDLGLTPVVPPDVLYHGTARRNLASIRTEGLLRRRRHRVHLSPNAATARRVGQRHGPPVVLVVAATTMHADGHVFYRTDNGVWLTEAVPPAYLEPQDEGAPW